MKDHLLKARQIKILNSYTNLGDHKHLLQVSWKFAAFPYISNTKAKIYNAQFTGRKLKDRPEKLDWLFIIESYWELMECPP